jgi:hypothetical protein
MINSFIHIIIAIKIRIICIKFVIIIIMIDTIVNKIIIICGFQNRYC